ncbi:EamA family transporter [Novosphingobium flavum]|uniref:EamA family transporter n=2 Tax=Novosphingobium flavum TaxID=1778672 RepID=A0A7X1KKM4_9SPHN|nr:EamA family transporter [Novosphingobium flavum]
MPFPAPDETPAVPVQGRLVAAFVLVALIWGSTWFVIKDQVSAVPPGWTITWRFAVATAGCFLLALARRDALRLPPGAQRLAVLVGLFQFCGNFQFVYRAEQHITSGIVAVLYALLMVPNAVLARIFLGQKLTGRFLAGSAVALGGIALLLAHELRVAPVQSAALLGIGFTLLGLTCASLVNVMQGARTVRAVPAVPMLAWAMLWGTLIDAVLALALDGAPRFDPRPAYWGGVLYLGLVGSVLTFPLYFELIRRWGAGRAAYNGVATPVIAMLLSTLFEGYRWTALAVGGSLLALAGLLVALSGREKA